MWFEENRKKEDFLFNGTFWWIFIENAITDLGRWMNTLGKNCPLSFTKSHSEGSPGLLNQQPFSWNSTMDENVPFMKFQRNEIRCFFLAPIFYITQL